MLIHNRKTINSGLIQFYVIFIGDLIRMHAQNLLKCLKLVQMFGVHTLIFCIATVYAYFSYFSIQKSIF